MKIMQKQNLLSVLLLSAALTTECVMASDVTGLTSFTAGTPARAADVNGNFTTVKTAVDNNQAQITALLARIAALETKLASVSNTTENGYPTVLFRGVNVRIDNGMGSTATANGTGNLIVGYNEADTSAFGRCTIGTNWTLSGTAAMVTDSTTCLNAGGSWIVSGGFKTGSHYIVTGTENNYSYWGGLLAGWQNTSNYQYSSVIGGFNNTASGSVSTVTGGHHNHAGGDGSSVSGGWANTASGGTASISGGAQNTASGAQSSVSGGGSTGSASNGNVASGILSSVSGGYGNIADMSISSILGGVSQNTATDYQPIPALP